MPGAAKRVFVHPNTFRYRLRRLTEISGLDLDDPLERLVAELQLRISMLTPRAPREPRSTTRQATARVRVADDALAPVRRRAKVGGAGH